MYNNLTQLPTIHIAQYMYILPPSLPPSLPLSPSLSQSMYNNLTQLRRMADRFAGKNHFAADTLQRQVAKLSTKFSRFETHLAERRRIVVGSLRFHTSHTEVCVCMYACMRVYGIVRTKTWSIFNPTSYIVLL